MLGREEKEVDKLIDRCYTKGSPSYPQLLVFQRGKFLNELFSLLDKLDVVVKTNREVPHPWRDDCMSAHSETCETCDNCEILEWAQFDLIEAGYTAWKPLI